MSGWVRLWVILSVAWIIGVTAFSAYEYYSIAPEACWISAARDQHYPSLHLTFFSCDMYSDILSTGKIGWSAMPIHTETKLILFDAKKFAVTSIAPLALLSAIALFALLAYRWVSAGFKKP